MYHCFSISFFKSLISLTMKFFHLWLGWLKSPFRLFCLIFLVIQQSGHSDSRWQPHHASKFASHTFSPSALFVSLKEDLLTPPPGSRSYGGGLLPLLLTASFPWHSPPRRWTWTLCLSSWCLMWTPVGSCDTIWPTVIVPPFSSWGCDKSDRH